MERSYLTNISQAELERRRAAEESGLDPFEREAYILATDEDEHVEKFDDDPRAEYIFGVIDTYKDDPRTNSLLKEYESAEYRVRSPEYVSGSTDDALHEDLDRYKLLNKEDEKRLFSEVETYLEKCKGVTSFRNVTAQQYDAFAGITSIYKVMIACNRKLIASEARKKMETGVSFGQLVNAGVKGLAHAFCKFDITRGFKFSTYATPWIRQAIDREIAEHSRTIRVPVNIDTDWKKIYRTARFLGADLQEEVDDREIAAYLGESEEQVSFIRRVGSRSLTSLNMTIDEDGEIELGDLKEDERISDTLFIQELNDKSVLNDIFDGDILTDEEKVVISLRLDINVPSLDGLVIQTGKGQRMTYEEVVARLPVADEVSLTAIGKILGMSRKSVNAMEQHAYEKLGGNEDLREKLLSVA